MSSTRDFIPASNEGCLGWLQAYVSGITSLMGSIGLTTPQIDQMGELAGAFQASMTLTSTAATRTSVTIEQRQVNRAAAVSYARELARIINAHPGCTNNIRLQLGLNPRKPRGHAVDIDFAPKIDIVWSKGHSMALQFHNGLTRGKPDGVEGVTCFWMAGEEASDEPSDWTFGFATTKTTGTLDFPLSLIPGTKVFVTAFWRNSLDESGPAADAVSSFIGFTAANAAKATSLRKAA